MIFIAKERRVQKCIEILDMLKLSNFKPRSKAGKILLQEKDEIPEPLQKHQVQLNQKNLTEKTPAEGQPSGYSPFVVVTTKWENFD